MSETENVPEEPLEGAEAQQDDQAVDWTDVVSAATEQPHDPNAWKGEAKARLVAAGMDEQAAHAQVYRGTRVSTEGLLQQFESGVGSGQAAPTPGPTGTPSAGSSSPDPLGQGAGSQQADSPYGASEIESLRAELAQTRGMVAQQVAQQAIAEMNEVREELSSGDYPELRDAQTIEALKQQVRQYRNAEPEMGFGEALRLATMRRFGVRAGAPLGETRVQNVTTPAPTPKGSNAPGHRAATDETVKDRIAHMVYGNESEETVMGLALEHARRRRM